MQAPLKWQKYLLLAHFCLTTRERLDREIRRYAIDDRDRLVQDISRELAAGKDPMLYVVKLVTPDASGQLPNCRVVSQSDLSALSRFLNLGAESPYTEVWCCPTNMASSVRNVAGRLAFEDGWGGKQILEQVWRCSPRLLESITFNDREVFNWPYLRAQRVAWGWRFMMEEFIVPRGWDQTNEQVLAEAREAMIMLDGAREQLEVFAAALAASGMTGFSVEYKIVGSELWFIDWDTPDDGKVMRNFSGLSILL